MRFLFFIAASTVTDAATTDCCINNDNQSSNKLVTIVIPVACMLVFIAVLILVSLYVIYKRYTRRQVYCSKCWLFEIV